MTTVHTYHNGFRLIHQTSYNSIPVSFLWVFVKFGSIHETENGAAHFIEHMCFTGTRLSPESRQISMVYDKIGAFINAYTHKEYTCFAVKCPEEHTAKCMEVLSDIILHTKMSRAHYTLEKNVVREEMIRYNDNTKNRALDTTDTLLFRETPYEKPVDSLDYHTEANDLPFRPMIEMYRQFYQPDNMGISVISSLSFQTIKRMVGKTGFAEKTRRSSLTHVLYPSIRSTGDIQYSILRKKGVSANYIHLSFRTCCYGHPDMYGLYILKKIIGGYMSSRMFTLLRGQNGIIYESSCSLSCYKWLGNISLYSVCDPKKVVKNRENDGVLLLLIQLLNRLITHGITERELNESKGNIRGFFLQDMVEIQKIAIHNGYESIVCENPNVIPYDKLYETQYHKITRSEIHRILRQYFTRNNMSVVIVGEDVPDLALVQTYFTRFS